MAEQEQIERLRQSVLAWNVWRFEHAEIRPDLSGANLSGVKLIRTDFSGVNLNGAKLIRTDLCAALLDGADLRGADLRDADLELAHLSGADLRGAFLCHAFLGHADLRGADLSHADLCGTDLSSKNLDGADLSERFAWLSEADLNHADLRAHLSSTDLSRAHFNRADRSRVNLSGADLSGANLSYANLRGANLRGANLSYANLEGARLDGVNFSDTNLTSAKVSQANFNEVLFGRTIFAWVNLSGIKGLETAVHNAPSALDINSVTLPHDEPTRLHFLRGVGFTETQIEYLPSLLTPRPIEYASLFISYAHQDEAIAKRLHSDLRKKDVPCWFALHDLRPGTPILRGIEEAIHLQDKFLLILSKHAVNSAWIEREVDAALHQEIKRGQDVLFPIRLDNAVLESNAGWATRLQHRHIGDFTGWQNETVYQKAFTALLRHLKVTQPPTNRSASS